MPLGSLSNVLEVKTAETFKGAEVLDTSLPVGGTPPFPNGTLVNQNGVFIVTNTGNNIAYV